MVAITINEKPQYIGGPVDDKQKLEVMVVNELTSPIEALAMLIKGNLPLY